MIEFTEDMTNALNNSFADQMYVLVATSGASGMPDIAFKGTIMAWDKDHIAFWERAMGTTFSNLQANGQCCFLYRNPEKRTLWKFFGVAQLLTEGEVRQRVMNRTVEAELSRDPERKGAAVVVRIDKIVQGMQILQER